MRTCLDAARRTHRRPRSHHGENSGADVPTSRRRQELLSASRDSMNRQTVCQTDPELFVRRLFDCIDGGDWPGLSDFLHDEAVYARPGYSPFVGKQAIMNFYLEKRIVSSGQHVVEKVLSDGANIACWGNFSGTDKKGC